MQTPTQSPATTKNIQQTPVVIPTPPTAIAQSKKRKISEMLASTVQDNDSDFSIIDTSSRSQKKAAAKRRRLNQSRENNKQQASKDYTKG